MLTIYFVAVIIKHKLNRFISYNFCASFLEYRAAACDSVIWIRLFARRDAFKSLKRETFHIKN